MADTKQIIELYSELADKPEKDFGWEKGIENAKAHNYLGEWFDKLPVEIWDYCAAVGNPFEVGEIEKDSTVVDLGCGAGVDLLVSALKVGENGRVIGVDITPKMVQKAKEHIKLSGFKNIDVLENNFDNIDIADESVDIVISNGAINLTSCKESVFAEIYRILKPNGKIYFADMIDISSDEEESTCCSSNEDDWANCVAGTLREEKLIDIISKAGFSDVECKGLTHYKTAQSTSGATFIAKKIPSERLREKHWDTLFNAVDYTKVLWHQNSPSISLELIKKSKIGKDSSIIDIGCGASLLVDNLIDAGYKNITLLDISKTSLEIVKARLENNSDIPKYITTDITNFRALEKYDIWHDRAVFHFLLNSKDRTKYFDVLKESLNLDGVAIINTFNVGNSTECAGLQIVQYDKKKMEKELPLGLKLEEYKDYLHTTPKGTTQDYSYFIIKKTL